MLRTLRFSLQNAVYFIMLPFLVHVLFTFYIQGVLKLNVKFKVCKSVHHRTIQINHQPDATIFQFIIQTFVYSSKCFGCYPAHHQELNDCSGSLWFYHRIVVIVVLLVVVGPAGRPARPRTQQDYHYDTMVKPETATAVIELLMMGGKTPETCWAVNKRQDNKLKNLLHQVGDLFELNVKLRCQTLNVSNSLEGATQRTQYCDLKNLFSHQRKKCKLKFGHYLGILTIHAI